MANNHTLVHDDALCHYGVVGMKWGVRRAQKNGSTYTYTSAGTKRYKRKADRAREVGDTAKQKKYERYYEKSVELDRKMQENALTNSAGRAAMKTLVNGAFGNKTYETVRATSGGTKRVSRALGIVASYTTGPFGAIPARSLYVRGIDGASVRNYAMDLFDGSARSDD